jgi:hypothetical protein
MTPGLCLAALLAGCASTPSPPPPTWDGLEHRPSQSVDALYVNPEATFKAYRTVMIDPPAMALVKNWYLNRDISPVSFPMSDAQIDAVKSAISNAFVSIFAEELAAGGYQQVQRASADTLHVSPGLANVYMNTPRGTMNSLPMYEGRITLVMELRDGSTGQLLVRIVDDEVGDMGILERPNTVLNSPDFRRTVQAWAQTVRGCLVATDCQAP